MAIVGPLRELGVHDVFQLLYLSRKTGRLRVTSALRGNEGTVDFHGGRVIAAFIRDNPHQLGQVLVRSGRITEAELVRANAIRVQAGEPRRLGEILVAMGAVSPRELQRHLQRQVEAVVFELLSWSEGYFSFTEGLPDGDSVDPGDGLATEALLMEAARRIDEWARIADKVPGPGVVPEFCDDLGDQPAALDLRPHEWQVLTAIDGLADLRSIAITAGVSEFDAARIVYGLMTTGVVRAATPARPASTPDDTLVHLGDARDALRDGRFSEALAAARRAQQAAPEIPEAHAIAGQALEAIGRIEEAQESIDRAIGDPDALPAWFIAAARMAIRQGDLARACECWRQVMERAPGSPEAAQARDGLQQASRLSAVVEVSHGR
jgi:tetratricopeptide (TPR) repeat protein